MLKLRQKNDINRILQKFFGFNSKDFQQSIMKEFKQNIRPLSDSKTIESIFDMQIFKLLEETQMIYKDTNKPISLEISRIICRQSDALQKKPDMNELLKDLFNELN